MDSSDEPGYKNTVHEINYLHHYSGGQCMNYLLTAADIFIPPVRY